MDPVTFVERVARKIAQLGLSTPAILLLEAHKPVAFLGGQFLLVAQPTLDFFISPRLTQGMVDLLTDPAQLEQLMTHLEQPPPNPPNLVEKEMVTKMFSEESS